MALDVLGQAPIHEVHNSDLHRLDASRLCVRGGEPRAEVLRAVADCMAVQYAAPAVGSA